MTEPVKTEVLLKGKLKMNFLSQHQFDTATKNPNELYYVPDSTESDISASIALHNNSQSSHPYILGQLDNKISKYSNFNAITDEIHDGDIVEYVGATDSVSGFINGYFYQANGHQVTVGQILPSETTASSLTFTFDVDTYLQYWTDQSVSPAPTSVTFTFDGTNWTSTETGDVDVATLGTSLGITYTGTAVQDDEFIVALSETTIFTWLQKNVQPATSIDGTVDDVKIYGTSKVDRPTKTANLKVVEQEDNLPTASIDYLGRIYQYTGATNQNYHHGYFYECIEIPGEKYVVNPEWWNDEGLTSVEIDESVLDEQVQSAIDEHGYTTVTGIEVGFSTTTSGMFCPVGDGSWGFHFSTLAELVTCGITVTGTPTTNTYLAWTIDNDPTSTYEWTAIPVQPDAEPISSQEINALWE